MKRYPTKNAPLAERAVRFRVLRDFSGLKAGQLIDTTGWPFGRAAALVRQRYLVPVTEAHHG